MDQRYLEAIINRDDHVVLGRRLHPFSLYDALFLTVDNNPLFVGGRRVVWQDLETAALICSTPPEVFLSAGLEPKTGLARLRRFIWNVRMRRTRTLTGELEKFMAYRDDYDTRPKFWDDEAGTNTLKSPWILSVASFLEYYTNMTEREIMTAPIGKMLWKSAAIAEQHGLTKAEMLSEEEEQALADMGIEV